VTEKSSLLVVKSFVLKDKTGEIRVITDRVLPNVGDKVVVHGRLEERFLLGISVRLSLLKTHRKIDAGPSMPVRAFI
jgi:hypothetical protein